MKKEHAVTIHNRLAAVYTRIEQAARRCHRNPENIRLVVVTKTQSIETVRQAIGAGARIIGENYIQESRTKFDVLIDTSVQWHFIGHLQRNKAKYAVRLFDLIHTVDSMELAIELDRQAVKTGERQKVLVQVNVSREKTKSGVSRDETLELVRNMSHLEYVHVEGLMTMPPFFDAPEKTRPFFSALRELQEEIRTNSVLN